MSCNKRRRIRAQPYNRIGNLVWRTEPAYGLNRHVPLFALRLPLNESVGHAGAYGSGANGIHPYALCRVFQRRYFGEGLAKREIRPVFEGAKITLQSLFMCQQVFSSAVIGHVESRYGDEAMKNELCQVVPHPELDRDYVAAMLVSMENMARWGSSFARWLRKSRLCFAHHESAFKLILSGIRARRIGPLATGRMRLILEQEFPGRALPSG